MARAWESQRGVRWLTSGPWCRAMHSLPRACQWPGTRCSWQPTTKHMSSVNYESRHLPSGQIVPLIARSERGREGAVNGCPVQHRGPMRTSTAPRRLEDAAPLSHLPASPRRRPQLSARTPARTHNTRAHESRTLHQEIVAPKHPSPQSHTRRDPTRYDAHRRAPLLPPQSPTACCCFRAPLTTRTLFGPS
jgi:hypothetical protein